MTLPMRICVSAYLPTSKHGSKISAVYFLPRESASVRIWLDRDSLESLMDLLSDGLEQCAKLRVVHHHDSKKWAEESRGVLEKIVKCACFQSVEMKHPCPPVYHSNPKTRLALQVPPRSIPACVSSRLKNQSSISFSSLFALLIASLFEPPPIDFLSTADFVWQITKDFLAAAEIFDKLKESRLASTDNCNISLPRAENYAITDVYYFFVLFPSF